MFLSPNTARLFCLFALLFILGTPHLIFGQDPVKSPEHQRFDQGRRLLASGDLDGAIKALSDVIRSNPRHIPSHLILGIVYTQKGQVNRAIAILERAVQIDTKSFAAHLLLGKAYAAKQKNEQAKAALKRAITINADLPSGYYFLGLLLQSEGKVEKALALYQVAASLPGTGKEKKQAQAQVDVFKVKSQDFFKQGEKQLNDGNAKSAKQLFLQVLRLDPDREAAFFNLALIAMKEETLDEAITAFKHALTLNPNFHSARLFLGEALEKQGKVSEAIDQYRLIVSRSSNQEEKEVLLARKKMRQIGETPEVGRIVQSLLQAGARFYSEEDYDAAEAEFSVVLTFLPHQVRVHYQLGLIALKKKNQAEAEKRFKKAIDLEPAHFPSYFALADLYEQQQKQKAAIAMYEKAVKVSPQDKLVNLRLAILYEREGEISRALAYHHKVVSLSTEENAPERLLSQGRINLYENKYILSLSNSTLTYNSNSNQGKDPLSELSSESSFSLTYFLKKNDRYRLPIQYTVGHRFLHRSQIYFINNTIDLFYLKQMTSSSVLFDYNVRLGLISGAGVKSGPAFLSQSLKTEWTVRATFPSRTTLGAIYQDISVKTNPIFSSKRVTGTLSFSQNLRLSGVKVGNLNLNFSYLDNAVEANDQQNRAQTYGLSYSHEVLPRLTATMGLSRTQSQFLNDDSLSQSTGLPQKRKNNLSTASFSLSYRPTPGFSIFASYILNANRSSLPVPSEVSLVDINAGQVSSLGDYDQRLLTLGITGFIELKKIRPRWAQFGKRLSVGLTSGYYKPDLGELNRIIGDSGVVIAQDPNHILPSNPTFLSEARNVATPPLGGSTSLGFEAEWEVRNRHGLVLSISEWQNSTVTSDVIPLVLRAGSTPTMVPRSARYNLTINQVFLAWRYSLINKPSVGRLYLDMGLIGGSFANLTIDSLLKVSENPVGNPFASFGSIEARGRSFTTRVGIGGMIFVRPWLSIGLSVNYLWGSVTRLTVKREFPAGFRAIPEGLPGVQDGPCFRLVNNRTRGETLSSIECAGDQVVGDQAPQTIRLKLDGFEARAAIRFHFGAGGVGQTPFEKWVNWVSDDKSDSSWGGGSWSSPEGGRTSPFGLKGLRVDGALKNETAFRINTPVTFTKAMTLFRLNTRYQITPNLSFTGRLRTYYDAIYDFVDPDTLSPRRFENTVLTQLPREPSPEEIIGVDPENSRGVQINQQGLELRETYFDFRYKKLDIRLGKQIVRWGVVDDARVTDLINPFDFGEFILREVEDRFIPLTMLKADFFPGDARFEFIWVMQVEPHQPAPKGSEFEQFEILPGFVKPGSMVDASGRVDFGNINNSELALRAQQNFGGWEMGLTSFYTWDDFPASFRSISETDGFNTTPEVNFRPRMNRVFVVGATFSKSYGRMVLNAEVAYTFGKLFGTGLKVASPGVSGNQETLGELERDFVKYAANSDFSLFHIDMSLSLVQQYIPNWDSTILQDRLDTVLAHFMRKTFLNESMAGRMLTLYFLNESDILFRPALESRLTDKVKTVFGADIFIGDRGTEVGRFDFIGFFKDSNRIYLELIYSF